MNSRILAIFKVCFAINSQFRFPEYPNPRQILKFSRILVIIENSYRFKIPPKFNQPF